jgi:uncharacterized protein (DUF1330 family)
MVINYFNVSKTATRRGETFNGGSVFTRIRHLKLKQKKELDTMSVYIIARFKIHDRSEYDRYSAGFSAVFQKFDGKMLSVDEDPTVLAGEWDDTRSVIIEFPSKESALAWMTSDKYQAIAKHRNAGSTANSILVKGLDA